MRLIIGLMSGTSIDAIDAALCRFDGGTWQGVIATHSQPYPAELRDQLIESQLSPDLPRPLRHWLHLDEQVAHHFAGAANALLKSAQVERTRVEAIGSHGQTVFHEPRRLGSSWQLGNPNRIAALTGITTVADFRRADIAHGGEGAPLVPAFHQALFASPDEARCVLNIGGIANLSVFDPGVAKGKGFDVGPGNALMDAWCQHAAQRDYDEAGAWARSGTLDTDLLGALLAEPYFGQPPPKSTGRDHFNLAWLRSHAPHVDQLNPADVQRTLCELSAITISAAISMHAPAARKVLVCGGGAYNRFLMSLLARRLPHVSVEYTEAYGLDGRWVEAAAFAWLASCTLDGRPGNLPSATGADRPVILGGIYRA